MINKIKDTIIHKLTDGEVFALRQSILDSIEDVKCLKHDRDILRGLYRSSERHLKSAEDALIYKQNVEDYLSSSLWERIKFLFTGQYPILGGDDE